MAIEKILYPAQKAATLPKLKNGGNVVPIPPNPGAPDWYDEDYYKKKTASPSTDGILAAMSESDLRRFYGGWLVPHGFSENEILNMPMDELEEIFNAIMGSRE